MRLALVEIEVTFPCEPPFTPKPKQTIIKKVCVVDVSDVGYLVCGISRDVYRISQT